MKVEITTLPVAALEVCDRARVRHQRPKDGSDIVLEYAEAYQCGLITEPLDVFREKGTERYIVADGEHRFLALRRAKIKEVECRLHEGDEIDALDFAQECNSAHGVRRTKADIYHAVVQIMEITRLTEKYRTNEQISEHLRISIRSVQKYRADWRDSDGGSSKTRARKQEARTSAKKHAPPIAQKQSERKMNACMSEEPQKQAVTKDKPASAPQSEPPKETRKEAAKPSPKAPESAKAPVSKIIVSDVRRALGMLCDVPPSADLAAELGASDWPRVEKAHAFLSELLGKKHV